VTTPSDLKLWTHEFSYVSWIWFGLVDLWYHNSRYQTIHGMSKKQ